MSMKDNMFVLVTKDWLPIKEEGKVKFKEYEKASKKAKELAPKIGGVILTSEQGLLLKDLQNRGYHYELINLEKKKICKWNIRKADIVLLPPKQKEAIKEKNKIIIPIYREYPYEMITIKISRNCKDEINQAIADYWNVDECDEEKFIKKIKKFDKEYGMELEILPKIDPIVIEEGRTVGRIVHNGCEVIPFDFSTDQFVGVPNP